MFINIFELSHIPSKFLICGEAWNSVMLWCVHQIRIEAWRLTHCSRGKALMYLHMELELMWSYRDHPSESQTFMILEPLTGKCSMISDGRTLTCIFSSYLLFFFFLITWERKSIWKIRFLFFFLLDYTLLVTQARICL